MEPGSTWRSFKKAHSGICVSTLDAPAGKLGVSCLQEVLDEASPKLRARLGLRTYGTLGMINGTRTTAEARASLGNYDVEIPEFLIGEGERCTSSKKLKRLTLLFAPLMFRNVRNLPLGAILAKSTLISTIIAGITHMFSIWTAILMSPV